MEYNVIKESNLTRFKQRVEQALNDGYNLTGGVFVEYTPPIEHNARLYNQVYYQSLYREN